MGGFRTKPRADGSQLRRTFQLRPVLRAELAMIPHQASGGRQDVGPRFERCALPSAPPKSVREGTELLFARVGQICAACCPSGLRGNAHSRGSCPVKYLVIKRVLAILWDKNVTLRSLFRPERVRKPRLLPLAAAKAVLGNGYSARSFCIEGDIRQRRLGRAEAATTPQRARPVSGFPNSRRRRLWSMTV